MKVLLLMPESIYDSWPISSDVIGRVVGFPAATFPQLAGSIPGNEIKVYDGLVQRTTTAQYINLLRWADVVGINAVSSLGTLNTLITIKFAKKVNPNVRIVLGGHHATFYSREWLREGADFIVRREGERTLPELLGALEHGEPPRDVKGVSYIEDGRLRENPDRPLIRGLDSLPMPRWNIMLVFVAGGGYMIYLTINYGSTVLTNLAGLDGLTIAMAYLVAICRWSMQH
jgi:radical SAM superfamily enzyme YgiQ (UPF0313 family)